MNSKLKVTIAIIIFTSITVAILIFTWLFSVTNRHNPNEKNFLSALKQHYQNSKLCIEEPLPFNISNVDKLPLFQRNIIRQLEEDPTSNIGRVIGLEKAGLIKKPNSKSKFYELTELGKQYSVKTTIHRPFQDQKNGLKFCYGKIEPTKVVNWDIPDSNSSSRSTIVTYMYQVSNLANWANSDSIKNSYPQISKVLEFQNKKEIKQLVKLTNNGWVVIE